MGMMINRRRVMGGKSLPYDAEIEYLKSTGTQWVDVDVSVFHPTDSFTIELNTAFTDNSHRALTGTNPWMYFGVSANKQFEVARWYVRNYDNDFHLWKLIHTNTNYSDGTVSAFVDSKNVKQSNITYSNIVKSRNYWILFYATGSHIKGEAQVHAAQKIKSGKITKNNVIVRDMIPVRVGQVGYLYDKVSGQLFGNAGTDAFILGPDKGNPVNINVKTHSTGDSDASLDVITGGGESVNIRFTYARDTPWTNEHIIVGYNQNAYSWEVYAMTSCLYDGQVYNTGELIATWDYREIGDIIIVANI